MAYATKIETLRQALLTLLAQHEFDDTLPTSARFLFYELVADGTISKKGIVAGFEPRDGKAPARADSDVINALTSLRKDRKIPWDWIVDETRQLESYVGPATMKAGLDAYLSAVRTDPWDGYAPLILTESRSLAGALRSLASEYQVRIAATNGQVGGFLHTDVVPALIKPARDRLHPDKAVRMRKLQILYAGDWDLAGNDIESNTQDVIEEYRQVEWDRMLLTAQQVTQYALPVIQKSDSRFKNGGTHDAVECEALSQKLIVQIVQSHLDALLPAPLASFEAADDLERDRLRNLLSA